jgi:hypothetical protein
VLFLFGRVNAVRGQIHREAVHHLLDWEILKFLIVVCVILVKHGNETARASYVDSTKARIELHHIGTGRHRQVRNGLVSVQSKNCEGSISRAQKESALMFRVDRHAMIELAAIYWIFPQERVCRSQS